MPWNHSNKIINHGNSSNNDKKIANQNGSDQEPKINSKRENAGTDTIPAVQEVYENYIDNLNSNDGKQKRWSRPENLKYSKISHF